MAKVSKRFAIATKQVDKLKFYHLTEGINLVKQNATARFDESVDVAIKLGVDPRKADQLVRGTVSLPHGIGKKVRVAVVARELKAQEALDAGADIAVSYTHLRAHETVLDLVCRLLLEKKKTKYRQD